MSADVVASYTWAGDRYVSDEDLARRAAGESEAEQRTADVYGISAAYNIPPGLASSLLSLPFSGSPAGQGVFIGAALQHLAARGIRTVEIASHQPVPCGPVSIVIRDTATQAWVRCTGAQLDEALADLPPSTNIYALLSALEKMEGVTAS